MHPSYLNNCIYGYKLLIYFTHQEKNIQNTLVIKVVYELRFDKAILRASQLGLLLFS